MRSVLLYSHTEHRTHSELSIRLKFVWFYQLTAAAPPHSVQVIWIKLIFRCVDISTGKTKQNKKTLVYALTLHWTIIVIIEAGGEKKNEMTARRNKNNGSLTPYIFQLISPRKKKRPPPPILMSSSFDFIVRTKQQQKNTNTKPNWAIRLKPLNIMKVVNDRTNMKVCMRVCRRKSKHIRTHSHSFCHIKSLVLFWVGLFVHKVFGWGTVENDENVKHPIAARRMRMER